jgi:hypothetical protein
MKIKSITIDDYYGEELTLKDVTLSDRSYRISERDRESGWYHIITATGFDENHCCYDIDIYNTK